MTFKIKSDKSREEQRKFLLILLCCTENKNNIPYIGCLNIHGTHVTANNSINDNVAFFFASYFKIVYYHIYQPLRSGSIGHKVNFLSGV